MTTQIVSAATVLTYLGVDATTTGQYSTSNVNAQVLAAQSELEQACHRYFADIAFAANAPWLATTMLRAVVPLPGFRSFTTVTWGGATLVTSGTGQSAWPLPDAMQTGVYTGLQFRPWRTDTSGPWWLSDPLWWDKDLDSPFYPANYGGGFVYSSMPNDLSIVGSAGYSPGAEPAAVIQAVTVLAAFKVQRPASILADVAITPAGGVLNYSQMPAEVRDFVAAWRIGPSVVSVG